MVTHYLTLGALTLEIDRLFRSSVIQQVFTQQKNELIISAAPARGVGGPAGDVFSLHVSVEPRLNYLFMEQHTSRARRNSVDIFGETGGAEIREVSVVPYDRTVKVALRDGRLILLQLYGSAESNVFLTDERLTILNAFKNRNRLEGSLMESRETRFDPAVLTDPAAFAVALRKGSVAPAARALREAVPILGTLFAREALYRAGIVENAGLLDLNDADIGRLRAVVSELLAGASKPSPAIYYQEKGEPIFSVITLRHLSGVESRPFDSVSEGVRSFIANAFRSRTFESERNDLSAAVAKELDRAKRSLEAAGKGTSDSSRAMEYERLGRLVMGNLHRIEMGASTVEVSDPAPGQKSTTVRIALNPSLTPARNAQEYFEKARRARTAGTETAARLQALRKRAGVLEELLSTIGASSSAEEVAEARKKYARLSGKGPAIRGGKDEPSLPFRTFEVTGGFTVLAGKSSSANDLLTTKYAKPDDLWFHTRGASGSHTVLKVKKGQPVPKEAIRAAAAIAAYYSKMRNASNVPVAYCERKYVRKPKGAPPGTVTLEREEIVFVKPRLP